MSEIKIETKKAYVVHCSTGCTCCSGDNHYRGPFKTKEEADKRAKDYWERRVLASQYASHGNYSVSEVDVETFPDGRLIVDGTHIFAGFAEDTYSEIMEGF